MLQVVGPDGLRCKRREERGERHGTGAMKGLGGRRFVAAAGLPGKMMRNAVGG
jgi:hypothetical protein